MLSLDSYPLKNIIGVEICLHYTVKVVSTHNILYLLNIDKYFFIKIIMFWVNYQHLVSKQIMPQSMFLFQPSII